MAKKQSFESKLKKGQDPNYKSVKVIFSYQAKDTGTWRFAEKVVKVPVEGDESQLIEAEVKAGMEYIDNVK